ncbi:conserved hypothetical protein [Coccidioides posadasii str. Silveira]|uniref:F-box domain-containing protein n=2 Tax=Coccidioides posadasii TaxID=199306 RepID=E9CWC0_COCPS|nr:conserved hypothetical protein [Coccidioides posadasii str. Silveira]
MGSLELLPLELLIIVAKELSLNDIANLLRTSKRLSLLLKDEFYREAVLRDKEMYHGQPVSLIQAACFDQLASFEALLYLTNDINPPIIKLDQYPVYDSRAPHRVMAPKGVRNITILQAVCSLGNERMVKLVLDNDVDTEVHNDRGFTALHQSVLLNQTSIIKFLIDGGADVRALHGSCNTPLSYAFQYGFLEAAKMLVKAGGGNIKLPPGPNNPLSHAVTYGRLQIVKELLEASSSYFPEPCLTAALPGAAKTGNVDLVQYLLDAGAKATPDALGEACGINNLAMIRLLIDAGVDVRGRLQDGTTALYSVWSMGAAKTLLNEAPNLATIVAAGGPAVDRVYGLCDAEKNSEIIPLILLLLEVGPQEQVFGDTLLRQRAIHYAAQHGHEPVLRAILKKQRWQVFTRSDTGRTALHYATSSSSDSKLTCVRLLVEAGVDIFAVDLQGNTALQGTFHKERHPLDVAVTQYLVNAGADVCHTAENGGTALLDALRNQDPESALVLIEADSDVSAEDEKGRRPLHHAAKRGYFPVARELIRRGAEISPCNRKQNTPLHVAIYRGWRKYKEQEEYVKMVELAIIRRHKSLDLDFDSDSETLRGNGHLAVIQLLCSLGADLHVRASKLDLTPLDLVRMQRYYWEEFSPKGRCVDGEETALDLWWKLGTYIHWQNRFILRR